MSNFFSHPVFQSALADIESLGIKIHQHPMPGAKPYAVVGGRSNARWWLIPMESGRVAASGLALFQPLLASARILKAVASALSRCGLSRLWSRNRVYILGEPNLACHFHSTEPLTYAYFTGTDSPHRKVAVQIMDSRGNLKGFAKVTQNPAVSPLLAHEAATLNYLATLNLRTANIPKVLYHGTLDTTDLLVTDTLKTPYSKTATTLQPAHLAFLKELAEKTSAAPPPSSAIARGAATRQSSPTSQSNSSPLPALLAHRYAAVAHRLPEEWQIRIQQAIDYLHDHSQDLTAPTLTHGDFTPWNTFFADGMLYVFDWEYAETQYPASNDLIHFLLADPAFRKRPPGEQIKRLVEQTRAAFKPRCDKLALNQLTVYLLSQVLHHIERADRAGGVIETWDGSEECRELINAVLKSGPCR